MSMGLTMWLIIKKTYVLKRWINNRCRLKATQFENIVIRQFKA
jgi:hypothetical protein